MYLYNVPVKGRTSGKQYTAFRGILPPDVRSVQHASQTALPTKNMVDVLRSVASQTALPTTNMVDVLRSVASQTALPTKNMVDVLRSDEALLVHNFLHQLYSRVKQVITVRSSQTAIMSNF